MTTYVLTFESTHAAMAASRALTSAAMRFDTIPVPTSISAGCGIALRFTADDPHDVLACLFGEEARTDDATLYRAVVPKGYKRDAALRTSR